MRDCVKPTFLLVLVGWETRFYWAVQGAIDLDVFRAESLRKRKWSEVHEAGVNDD